MAKKRKTKKQKILADIRVPQKPRNLQSSPPESTRNVFTFSANLTSAKTLSQSSSYDFVKKDLKKTFFLTAFIVIIELGLKLLTK